MEKEIGQSVLIAPSYIKDHDDDVDVVVEFYYIYAYSNA